MVGGGRVERRAQHACADVYNLYSGQGAHSQICRNNELQFLANITYLTSVVKRVLLTIVQVTQFDLAMIHIVIPEIVTVATIRLRQSVCDETIPFLRPKWAMAGEARQIILIVIQEKWQPAQNALCVSTTTMIVSISGALFLADMSYVSRAHYVSATRLRGVRCVVAI